MYLHVVIFIIYHISHATWNISRVRWHMSRVTRHMSRIWCSDIVIFGFIIVLYVNYLHYFLNRGPGLLGIYICICSGDPFCLFSFPFFTSTPPTFLHLYPSNVSLPLPLQRFPFFTSTPPTFLHLYPSNVSSSLALRRFFTSSPPTFLHL